MSLGTLTDGWPRLVPGFEPVQEGILRVDRYAAYQATRQVKEGLLVLAFGRARVRRDFLEAARSWPTQEARAPGRATLLLGVLQTLCLWNLNPRAWRTAYPGSWATAGGQAPRAGALARFLPWKRTEEQRQDGSVGPKPPTEATC